MVKTSAAGGTGTLVGELRSHMLRDVAEKLKNKNKNKNPV